MRAFERSIAVQEKTCCSGVTLPQCHVLLEIEEKEQATTGQLAKSLNLDKSTLSRTIDGLVNDGQLERLENPSDRRYIPLSLTKKGHETCESINGRSDDYYARALEQIPPPKLERIIANISTLVEAFSDQESKNVVTQECCEQSEKS